jgi:DNA-binding transcriptional MerR regulator
MSSAVSPEGMTIDDLARAAGVLTSTVRLYQNRGLLAPPERRGRVGYYGEGHLARLRLIASLQERGFSLAAIRELVEGLEAGESLRAVLGLGEGPPTWTAEAPESLTLGELAARLPGADLTPALLRRVVDLGLVELPSGTAGPDSEVVVRSPAFLAVGRRLSDLGVPAEVILDQYELLRADAAGIASRFTDVFRDHLWAPFVESGMPAERIASLVSALETLGPLAESVVVTALRQALQDRAEAFIRAETERLGVDIPRPGVRG